MKFEQNLLEESTNEQKKKIVEIKRKSEPHYIANDIVIKMRL